MPRRLRPVGSGEKAEAPRKLSVAEAAADGTHRGMLVALRARIAASVQSPSTSAVALAALCRQLALISKELSVLDSAESEDAITAAAGVPDEAWDGAV
jgi:hypothetical protein